MILIHGASSAGKPTLARAVRAGLAVPFLHLTFDRLIDTGVLPRQGWRQVRPRVFAANLRAGRDVVDDHIIEEAATHADLRRLLCFAALHRPLDELTRREVARGDRGSGAAETDFATVHRGLTHALELRSLDGTEGNAARPVAALAQRGARSRFFDA